MSVDEISRIKEFHQIRKEIRGSEKYLFVGIDIGKETHYAFYGTATGKTLKRRLVFRNDFSGFGFYTNPDYIHIFAHFFLYFEYPTACNGL